MTTQTMADRALMTEAVARYAWGYDMNDFDMLGSVFTEDATSGGVVTGTDIKWGPMQGRDQIVSILKSIRDAQTDQRRHNTMNVIVRAQDDSSASLVCNVALSSSEGGQTKLLTAGYYEVDLTKQGDAWLITRLDGVLDSPF
ncbi:nuclear transport factor 2 family protein [Pseudooceanicola sp. CBS1P-1]|uniref:SnoaL-like domain-containing protein n=1 Tax=Pseudooceanicola albus TaxID=2692189 RepID=A0A6L7G8Q5_9RHOB|nr:MULTISPECIES: nuclear transport factor 2 family protein [Pseudooceanicola]MBT9384315.1 nuclear transport factor 2 family protein [Pseudooceanicola endophyticus]MXN19947.1 hypothetical protein [Pseudooceanicola albus]